MAARWILSFFLIFGLFVVSFDYLHESVFFSANVPYDKLEDNPRGFVKPTDYNMSYSPLKVATEDN